MRIRENSLAKLLEISKGEFSLHVCNCSCLASGDIDVIVWFRRMAFQFADVLTEIEAARLLTYNAARLKVSHRAGPC